MIPFADFYHFLKFNQAVLERIVQEGEAKLQAQLNVATASDQRAISFLGFLVGAATAVIGAAVVVLLSKRPDITLLCIAYLYAAALMFSASKAVKVFKPKAFSFPGNEPQNWVTTQWNFENLKQRTIKHALVEQCYTLNQAIQKNTIDMKENAKYLKQSIDISIYATIAAGFALACYSLILLYHKNIFIFFKY